MPAAEQAPRRASDASGHVSGDGALTPAGYRPRLVDQQVEKCLQTSRAVLIEGPRACGKTWTGRRFARSEVLLDSSDATRLAVQTDPAALLAGEPPRLIDEWQLSPDIWNPLRRACDDRNANGQFILTGSATPADDIMRHTGAGRVRRVHMRPMTSWETGESDGSVSLGALLAGRSPQATGSPLEIPRVVEAACRGGWPWLADASADDAQEHLVDYIGEVSRTDLPHEGLRRRDPLAVRRLLASLGRNESTAAAYRTLAADVSGGRSGDVSPKTVKRYVDALIRLFVIEPLPAWLPHTRSTTQLRSTPKRYFCDPSLAVASLAVTADRLRSDIEFFGLVFESLAIRDLRGYAQSNRARVSYYNDNAGLEADAIVEGRDRSWVAFEVKLGGAALVEQAADSLRRLRDKVDTKRMGAPSALVVITAGQFGFNLGGGVSVVPFTSLGP